MNAILKNETELRIEGIEALNKALGPSDAFRFLTLIHKEPTDYVEVSKKLYEGMNVQDIYQRAKKNWKKRFS